MQRTERAKEEKNQSRSTLMYLYLCCCCCRSCCFCLSSLDVTYKLLSSAKRHFLCLYLSLIIYLFVSIARLSSLFFLLLVYGSLSSFSFGSIVFIFLSLFLNNFFFISFQFSLCGDMLRLQHNRCDSLSQRYLCSVICVLS